MTALSWSDICEFRPKKSADTARGKNTCLARTLSQSVCIRSPSQKVPRLCICPRESRQRAGRAPSPAPASSSSGHTAGGSPLSPTLPPVLCGWIYLCSGLVSKSSVSNYTHWRSTNCKVFYVLGNLLLNRILVVIFLRSEKSSSYVDLQNQQSCGLVWGYT